MATAFDVEFRVLDDGAPRFVESLLAISMLALVLFLSVIYGSSSSAALGAFSLFALVLLYLSAGRRDIEHIAVAASKRCKVFDASVVALRKVWTRGRLRSVYPGRAVGSEVIELDFALLARMWPSYPGPCAATLGLGMEGAPRLRRWLRWAAGVNSVVTKLSIAAFAAVAVSMLVSLLRDGDPDVTTESSSYVLRGDLEEGYRPVFCGSESCPDMSLIRQLKGTGLMGSLSVCNQSVTTGEWDCPSTSQYFVADDSQATTESISFSSTYAPDGTLASFNLKSEGPTWTKVDGKWEMYGAFQSTIDVELPAEPPEEGEICGGRDAVFVLPRFAGALDLWYLVCDRQAWVFLMGATTLAVSRYGPQRDDGDFCAHNELYNFNGTWSSRHVFSDVLLSADAIERIDSDHQILAVGLPPLAYEGLFDTLVPDVDRFGNFSLPSLLMGAVPGLRWANADVLAADPKLFVSYGNDGTVAGKSVSEVVARLLLEKRAGRVQEIVSTATIAWTELVTTETTGVAGADITVKQAKFFDFLATTLAVIVAIILVVASCLSLSSWWREGGGARERWRAVVSFGLSGSLYWSEIVIVAACQLIYQNLQEDLGLPATCLAAVTTLQLITWALVVVLATAALRAPRRLARPGAAEAGKPQVPKPDLALVYHVSHLLLSASADVEEEAAAAPAYGGGAANGAPVRCFFGDRGGEGGITFGYTTDLDEYKSYLGTVLVQDAVALERAASIWQKRQFNSVMGDMGWVNPLGGWLGPAAP